MNKPAATRALLRCDGAVVPSALDGQQWDRRQEITTSGGDNELTMMVDHLQSKVAGEIDPRVLDLVRIAASCFAADQAVRRGGTVDVHREGWRREMTLCIPVTDVRLWSRDDILSDLTAVLGFGTGDTWEFAFDEIKQGTAQLPLHWASTGPGDAKHTDLYADIPDTVVLFSGGTDSLCALIEAMHVHGAHPVAVSHWPARHIQSRQHRLLSEVRDKFPERELPHVSFEIHHKNVAGKDSSQRSRGFLFACLGAAVAVHLGVRDVLLADNGYVSVNPPINDQLQGTLTSRGTHPKFLLLFNRLLSALFTGAVQVRNPLWNRTRAEALQVLHDAGCPDLLARTNSCGKHRNRPTAKPHCGGCSQCIDRRFAVIEAGLEAFDPITQYETDLFANELGDGEPRTVAVSYVRFAHAVSKIDVNRLFDEYEELSTCLDPNDPEFMEQAIGIADMLKRHAEQAMGVVRTMVLRHADAIAHRELADYSLLQLWLSDGGAAASDIDPAEFGVTVAPERPRFAQSNQVWVVEFHGEKGGLKDLAGTKRLARLLKEAGQELESLDLSSGSTPQSRAARQSKVDEVERTSGPGDAGTLLDDVAVNDYRHHLSELEAEIKMAQANDEGAKADHLRTEQRWLRTQLREGVGKAGRLRAFSEQHEKARSTVSKTVWGQVDQLQETMPRLHAHLRKWVRLGYLCWYHPDPPEPWDVVS